MYESAAFNPKVTSRSMHEMDLSLYQEAFLAQCPRDLCSAVREFLDLTGTHSKEMSLANARPGLHTSASSPEDSIAVAHKTFAFRETQINLVHPPGTLKDRLGVLLHWPTQVTTSEPPERNETADPGGPCPQLLTRKGVPVDGVLWLKTFARRAEHLKNEDRHRNFSPTDLWPRGRRKCHLQFSKWVFESSESKVWVIHERVNREIYQEWYQADLVPFETKCMYEIPSQVQYISMVLILYYGSSYGQCIQRLSSRRQKQSSFEACEHCEQIKLGILLAAWLALRWTKHSFNM